MKRLILIILLLTSVCMGMTEKEANQIVVDSLRMQLMQSERWLEWDRQFADWWRVDELRPYTGYF